MDYNTLKRDSMDLILDIFDSLLLSNRIDVVDELLSEIAVPNTPDLAVCILMTTLPARDVLPSRAAYAMKVEAQLLKQVGPKRTANIMKGLK